MCECQYNVVVLIVDKSPLYLKYLGLHAWCMSHEQEEEVVVVVCRRGGDRRGGAGSS